MAGAIVLVCGGRDYLNREHVFATLTRLHKQHGFGIVIQGGQTGADTLAKRWAESKCIPCAEVPAYFGRLGREAGPRRNAAMLLLWPDFVIAFPGGTGTANMLLQARRSPCKPHIIVMN